MRILLVEDDRSLADGLTASLKHAGYAVDHVPTGEDALASASSEHYDVIILDIGLPGIDGFEVLRKLREKKSKASVLVLTAYDAVQDRVKGLDLGGSSAQSVVLMAIVIVLTIVQFRYVERKVQY